MARVGKAFQGLTKSGDSKALLIPTFYYLKKGEIEGVPHLSKWNISLMVAFKTSEII